MVQWRSIDSALIGTESEFVPPYTSGDTARSKTISAVIQWLYVIRKPFKIGAEQHAKKVAELIHCYNFDIKAICNKLQSVIWCSEFVCKTSSGLREDQGFIKENMRIEEIEHPGKSIIYQQRLVEVRKM